MRLATRSHNTSRYNNDFYIKKNEKIRYANESPWLRYASLPQIVGAQDPGALSINSPKASDGARRASRHNMYCIYQFNLLNLRAQTIIFRLITQLQTEINSMIFINWITHQIDGYDAISILKNY